jgi:hypothetical protein
MEMIDQLHTLVTLPEGKVTWYPLYRMLDWLHIPSMSCGEEENL